MKYSFDGKARLLSLGTYPATGWKAGRDKRDQARRLIAQGVEDPSAARKAEKASRSESVVNGFESVAREWHATAYLGQVSAGHAARTLIRLEQGVFPWLGAAGRRDHGAAAAPGHAPDRSPRCVLLLTRLATAMVCVACAYHRPVHLGFRAPVRGAMDSAGAAALSVAPISGAACGFPATPRSAAAASRCRHSPNRHPGRG